MDLSLKYWHEYSILLSLVQYYTKQQNKALYTVQRLTGTIILSLVNSLCSFQTLTLRLFKFDDDNYFGLDVVLS